MQKQTPKRAPFAVPLLLGMLDAGPQHGYALFKTMQKDLHGICHIGMNRLYALLDEMETRGLTQCRAGASTSRPIRKTYQLTPRGRRIFHAWLAAPSLTMREMRVDFPPKLYLARQRGRDAMIELIDAQREACEREMSRMMAQMQETRHENDFLPMIYDFRVGQIKAGLAWLNKCRRKLGSAAVPA